MEKNRRILLLEKILRFMAVLVLKKYNPRVVGITGSVGKTSAKEAIFIVLASQFRVRRNEKNYNNEIGIPLTIIGANSGQGSVLKWLGVFFKWLSVMVVPLEYPEILILEMGADRPGDLKYLTDFIKLEVAVVTDISGSHLEFFQNIGGVAKEKGTVVRVLDENGLAILNVDNQHVSALKEQTKASVIKIGFSQEAEMRAMDPAFVYSDDKNSELKGLSFKLNYKGTTIPVRLNHVLARHQINPALVAVAAGTWFGLNLVEIGAALENFTPPEGRMRLISGLKNSMIIDDTYNSSPTSAVAAMGVLGEIESQRKIAILGDMLELGGETEIGHRNMAAKFLEIKGDIFFAVGRRMQFAAEELLKRNFPKENIYSFNSPMDAGKKIREIIQPGDLILIKGSQGMRMEKVVEEIMSEPQNSSALLCRQNVEWKNTPFNLN